MPHPDDTDLTGERAFHKLVATVRGRCCQQIFSWLRRDVKKGVVVEARTHSEDSAPCNPVLIDPTRVLCTIDEQGVHLGSRNGGYCTNL